MAIQIVFDENGKILSKIYKNNSNDIQIIAVDSIPDGKNIVGVDVSGEEPKVIFEDIPKPQNELLKEEIENLKSQLETQAEVIDYLLMK